MILNRIGVFWPEHSLQAGGRWFDPSTAHQFRYRLPDRPGRIVHLSCPVEWVETICPERFYLFQFFWVPLCYSEDSMVIAHAQPVR